MNRLATVTWGALGRATGVITVSLALVAPPAAAQTGTVSGAVTDGTSAVGIASAQVLPDLTVRVRPEALQVVRDLDWPVVGSKYVQQHRDLSSRYAGRLRPTE